jgi:hypothetical protein
LVEDDCGEACGRAEPHLIAQGGEHGFRIIDPVPDRARRRVTQVEIRGRVVAVHLESRRLDGVALRACSEEPDVVTAGAEPLCKRELRSEVSAAATVTNRSLVASP